MLVEGILLLKSASTSSLQEAGGKPGMTLPSPCRAPCKQPHRVPCALCLQASPCCTPTAPGLSHGSKDHVWL